MVNNSDKLNFLYLRIKGLAQLKWDSAKPLEKKLMGRSFEAYLNKEIDKFIAKVLKNEEIMQELDKLVDKTQYPDY